MAKNNWSEVILRDLVDIKHGFAFQGEYFTDEETQDILLTPGNFAIGGGYKGDKLKYYFGETPEEYILSHNDLIVTMTDLSKEMDTLGYSALVPEEPKKRFLHNQRLGKVIIRDEKQVDKYFLNYLLRTNDYRNEVKASASGSVIKHTSPDRIRNFQFLLPPLSEQRAIAVILGTLDEKIELHRCMNRTLENMAKAVFRQWFVESEEVKGWEVVPLPEVIEVNPIRSLKKGDVAPYLDMANMPTHGHRGIEWIDRPFGSGTKFINGDTLLARITPCLENGKTAYVDFLNDGQVGWGSTEYIVFHPKPPLPPEYGYYLARSEELRNHAIVNMTGTSGRQRTPASCFDNYLISVPPEDLAKKFGELSKSVIAKVRANDEESRTLVSLRDSLLPKLMRGEVRVKE